MRWETLTFESDFLFHVRMVAEKVEIIGKRTREKML